MAKQIEKYDNAWDLDMSDVIVISGLDYEKLTAMTKMEIGKRDGDDGNERAILRIGGFVDRVDCHIQEASEYCFLPNLPLHLHEASAVYSKNEFEIFVINIGGLSTKYKTLLKKVDLLDRCSINSNHNDCNNCNNSNCNNNGDFNDNEFDQWKWETVQPMWMKYTGSSTSSYGNKENIYNRLWIYLAELNITYSSESDNENADNYMKYTSQSGISKDNNNNYYTKRRTITKITTTATTTNTNTHATFLHSLVQIAHKFAVLFAFHGLSGKGRRKFSLLVCEKWNCLKMTVQTINGFKTIHH